MIQKITNKRLSELCEETSSKVFTTSFICNIFNVLKFDNGFWSVKALWRHTRDPLQVLYCYVPCCNAATSEWTSLSLKYFSHSLTACTLNFLIITSSLSSFNSLLTIITTYRFHIKMFILQQWRRRIKIKILNLEILCYLSKFNSPSPPPPWSFLLFEIKQSGFIVL